MNKRFWILMGALSFGCSHPSIVGRWAADGPDLRIAIYRKDGTFELDDRMQYRFVAKGHYVVRGDVLERRYEARWTEGRTDANSPRVARYKIEWLAADQFRMIRSDTSWELFKKID